MLLDIGSAGRTLFGNFFYAPTMEMKITFDLLRQGSLAG